MGCSNTNVKDEIPKKKDNNDKNNKKNNENSEDENEENDSKNGKNGKNNKSKNEESSRLDDDDDVDENMYKIPKYDPNHLLSEENKGILNLYNGKVRKYVWSQII